MKKLLKLIMGRSKLKSYKIRKKCWNCRHYEPIGQKYGACLKIKMTVNLRDFREESVSAELQTAFEHGWEATTATVLGYAVCDLFELKKQP